MKGKLTRYPQLNVIPAGIAAVVPSLRDPSLTITQREITQSVNAPSTR